MKRILLLSGVLAAAAYAAHVVIGGLLWTGYSHLMQPISDLTAAGAPDRGTLSVILYAYSCFALAFGVAAFGRFRRLGLRTASWGMILYIAMQLVSVSYSFFPEDLPGSAMTFAGTMHLLVTAVIVPFTIGAPVVTGLGMRNANGLARAGWFSVACGILIFFAGGATAVFFAQRLPFFGLVERINIGTLQAWTFVMSLVLCRAAHDGVVNDGENQS